MDKLKDLAKVVRSKNAGALLLTLDIIFEDVAVYERVRDSNVLNVHTIADLYGVSDNHIEIVPFDVAHAIKITLPRAVLAGSLGDTDVYGAQQHAPLLNVEVP